MEFTNEQKEALKKLVEEDGYGLFSDMENAKDELNELSKVVKEQYRLEPKDFKKMVKLFYKSSFDEDKAKNEEFYSLYEEIVG